MDRDLFLAVLALDTYNRGYDASLKGLSEDGALGTATIREFKLGEQDGWEDASFYAIAYEWNGETIISYRGTNFPDLSNITRGSVQCSLRRSLGPKRECRLLNRQTGKGSGTPAQAWGGANGRNGVAC